jgi:hypothetical protein
VPSLPRKKNHSLLTDENQEIALLFEEVDHESVGSTGTPDDKADDVGYLRRLAFRAVKDEASRDRLKKELLREIAEMKRKGRRVQKSRRSSSKQKLNRQSPKRRRSKSKKQSAGLQNKKPVSSKTTRRSSLAQIGGLAGILSVLMALVITVKVFANEENLQSTIPSSVMTSHEELPELGLALENSAEDEPALETSLDKWREQHQKLLQLLEEMNKEKELLICSLRESGIFSGEDLNEKSEARIYADELLEIVKTKAMVEGKSKSLLFAITQGESLQRKIHRQQRLQQAGITSEESAEFEELRIEIEDMLYTESKSEEDGNVLQLDEVLNRELEGYPSIKRNRENRR